ncbi:SapC family protein [Falsihalocynthiibacter sp. SS001]|uniref:SapC family protein n=1 Tax=Falsihalocynthiibacter sp. SS001 TaxID=3349698 RepID=UPI0036D245E3
MANPLFYKNVVPINSEIHRDLRFAVPAKPLEFAREANLIPALVDEFAHAMDDLPIAFLPGSKHPAAVFVTGLKPGTNVFISEEGLWDGQYAPAYLRRYPFIVGDVAEGDPLLCMDETYEGFGTDEGVRFFTKTGESEEPLQNALTIAQSYREAAERTDAFASMLQEMGLLRAVSLDGKTASGETLSVHGLLVLDEEAFDKLNGEQLEKLHQAGFLRAIFNHLQSLKAISRLGESLGEAAAPVADAVEDTKEKKTKKAAK